MFPTAQGVPEIGHSWPVPEEKPGLVMTDQLAEKTKAELHPNKEQETNDSISGQRLLSGTLTFT